MRQYERRGFRTVGIDQEQGLLDGKWVDVIVVEKLLGQRRLCRRFGEPSENVAGR
jgi:L-amino acid N-acyltransferase YncA